MVFWGEGGGGGGGTIRSEKLMEKNSVSDVGIKKFLRNFMPEKNLFLKKNNSVATAWREKNISTLKITIAPLPFKLNGRSLVSPIPSLLVANKT